MKGYVIPNSPEVLRHYAGITVLGAVLLVLSVTTFLFSGSVVTSLIATVSSSGLLVLSYGSIRLVSGTPDLGPEDPVVGFRTRLSEDGMSMYIDSETRDDGP